MEWFDYFVELVVDIIMNIYKVLDIRDVELCVLYKGGLYMIKVFVFFRGKFIDLNINGK